MKNKKIRTLKADEIEVRIGGFDKKKTGGFLLLYKDARVDMKILDEVFGPMNWQRSHEVINGNLFCNISVWDEDKKAWITKQDVGIESVNDATKGQASDAFKRAGFNWGIGRELYTAPFIYVKGLQKFDKFEVVSIGYNEAREITHLEIVNEKSRQVVYKMENGKQLFINSNSQAPKQRSKATNQVNRGQGSNNDNKASTKQLQFLDSMRKQQGLSAEEMSKLMKERFKVSKSSELTVSQASALIEMLKSI